MTIAQRHGSPDRGTDRSYLHVRPTDDSLAGDRVAEQFEQLHAVVDGTVECLLVADPETDEIRYYLVGDGRTVASLERVLARVLPDTYAVERADDDPLDALPMPAPDSESTEDTADDPVEPTVAAVELHGAGQREDDWQTRLRPPSTSDAPEQHRTARVSDAPGLPLASVIEGMRTADVPVAYQTLVRPKPDWGFEAEDRIRRIEREEDTVGQLLFKLLFDPSDDYREQSISIREAAVGDIWESSKRIFGDGDADMLAPSDVLSCDIPDIDCEGAELTIL